MTTSLETQLRSRAHDLLAEGVVELFLGYRQGSNPLRVAPFVARTPLETAKLVWNAVCVPNLAGTLAKHAGQRIGVALKACDAQTLRELLKLNQLERSRLYLIGIGCEGMANPEAITDAAPGRVTGLAEAGPDLVITTADDVVRRERGTLLLTKCATCTGMPTDFCDEWLGEAPPAPPTVPAERFAAVQALATLAPAERLAFWSEHLSRCTLCYACQTVCPLCFCKECALTLERDHPRRQAREPMTIFAYHLMRAYHLADRCTGCDECSRVCPEDIPLNLICRKLEQDRSQV
ncbi:4Fe-4S dicluster domain-containing protein [Candidatus Chloroploca sp. M-50]|uniref:4Fe-4S dicluster domain-containing protein n=1 Tax=Candidatus Chloroploca mongolica TaxID=2528176 RepID=A0ABS4DCU2_9CHLR|nr:4Fe-4S dicluster domain-containing protein [Candidatus Chloroploca mongolica]MBP1467268.1 4Fe-4S dicluster domain-containing protein [Candidatus Chloroploca mongolica]